MTLVNGVTMPCGFDEALVDFDNETTFSYNQDWDVTDFDNFGLSFEQPSTSEAQHSKTGGKDSEDPKDGSSEKITADSQEPGSTPDDSPHNAASDDSSKETAYDDSFASASASDELTDDDMRCDDSADDFCSPPTPPRRMSMLCNSKYRLKEERKKVLKLSMTKLNMIEDHEQCLRRSVLINNTQKRLQKEMQSEKEAKQCRSYHRTFSFTRTFSKGRGSSKCGCERKYCHRHRSVDDDDTPADVSEVFSQIYMPPTPRMITALDDDDLTNEPSLKRTKLDEENDSTSGSDVESKDSQNVVDVMDSSSGELRPTSVTPVTPQEEVRLRCGPSSVLGSLQSVVYHSLMASMES